MTVGELMLALNKFDKSLEVISFHDDTPSQIKQFQAVEKTDLMMVADMRWLLLKCKAIQPPSTP